jgi:hypothetical protein
MKSFAKVAILVFSLMSLLAVSPTYADSVVYNDWGPNSMGYDGIGSTGSQGGITDSFSCFALVDGVSFIAFPGGNGNSVVSVNWAITTQPFGGTTLASGTATNMSSILFGGNMYQETFSFSALALGSGTYWLELSDIIDSGGLLGAWEISSGPSEAFGEIVQGNMWSLPSETFQILGTSAGTPPTPPSIPEPSSFLLLGSGMAGLADLIKRKLEA